MKSTGKGWVIVSHTGKIMSGSFNASKDLSKKYYLESLFYKMLPKNKRDNYKCVKAKRTIEIE